MLRTKETLIYLSQKRSKVEDSLRLQKQKELIERIGMYNEKDGYQPVTARILGLLIVTDKEEYTFDEIVHEMQISKSTASNALKILELRRVIEYVTYPGDRKRYFRFISYNMRELIETFEKRIKQNIDLLDEVIALKKDPESRNSKFLKNMKKGMNFFMENLGMISEELENQY